MTMTEQELNDALQQRRERLDDIEEKARQMTDEDALRAHLQQAARLAEKLSEEAEGRESAIHYANLAQTLSNIDEQ